MVSLRTNTLQQIQVVLHRNRQLIPQAGWVKKNPFSSTTIGIGRSPNIRSRRRQFNRQNAYWSTTTGIAVAKFGLLSVATLPFTAWLALFTYDYYYRVEICRRRLSSSSAQNKSNGAVLGRDREISEVSALLADQPSQIIVIAGGNEAGKSTFVTESLQNLSNNCSSKGVTLVELAALVDSVSSFTHVLVNAFDLRWLKLRHSLIDVLPFAGSEILVMKERFGDRDLEQALHVITQALERIADSESSRKSKNNHQQPVIVIDGLGEGAADWGRTVEGRLCAQRFLRWCVYVTKEKRLAHVVLTGNEQLVLSLIDQIRVTRGHAKVIGLGDLSLQDAAKIIKKDLKEATEKEIEKITNVFGGFIHDLIGCSRDIQYRLNHDDVKSADERARIVDNVIQARFQQQVERVTAAFAQSRDDNSKESCQKGGGDNEADDDMDPFLDPLKSIYSEAQASQSSSLNDDNDDTGLWTHLQLWKTLQCLVESSDMAALFSELRDDIFDGDKNAILELMREDVLGFQVDHSSGGGWNWKVTPSTPAIGKAFVHLVNDSTLKERFCEIEQEEKRAQQMKDVEHQRARLYKAQRSLDHRKKSLLQSIDLAKELGKGRQVRKNLGHIFDGIAEEEEALEEQRQTLRRRLAFFSRNTNVANMPNEGKALMDYSASLKENSSIRDQLKLALLGEGVDSSSSLKDAFESFDGGQIAASDLVRLVRITTGVEMDIEAARSLISKWDYNHDKKLDQKEFVRMLLADTDDMQQQSKKGQ